MVSASNHGLGRFAWPRLSRTAWAMLGFAALVACLEAQNGAGKIPAMASASFRIHSPAFQPGRNIPQKYTCEGADVSPPLEWTSPPPGTESFSLIVEDPDAPSGVWTHWIYYNLPPTTRRLPEDVPKQADIPGGGLQGQNDFGRLGYGGPCPPPGKPHRYFFKLYALSSRLTLDPGASKEAVLRASQGRVLSEAEIIGRFKR